MPAITISDVSEETQQALAARASLHSRSAEAEMLAILEAVVKSEGRLRIGTAMAEMSQKIGLSNDDVVVLEWIINDDRAVHSFKTAEEAVVSKDARVTEEVRSGRIMVDTTETGRVTMYNTTSEIEDSNRETED